MDVEEQVLPLGTSLGQYYSSFHNNNLCTDDDPADDTNAENDNACLELINSM